MIEVNEYEAQRVGRLVKAAWIFVVSAGHMIKGGCLGESEASRIAESSDFVVDQIKKALVDE